jgi:uncharacterized protein (TIGR03083 family)
MVPAQIRDARHPYRNRHRQERVMDKEQSWRMISEQRLGLARLLEGLSVAEWEQPSLCVGWRVRDVAAHVAINPQFDGLGPMLVDAIRARGSFHRLNHDTAARHAERPTAEIVAELRRYANSRRLPVVTNYRNILFDIQVHAQDIAIPLGRDYPMQPEAARAGAERVWTMGWPFWARRRLRDLRLVATDIDWSAGAGAEVRGPIGMLLLLMTGRTATALPYMSGPGVHTIAQRFQIGPAAADTV